MLHQRGSARKAPDPYSTPLIREASLHTPYLQQPPCTTPSGQGEAVRDEPERQQHDGDRGQSRPYRSRAMRHDMTTGIDLGRRESCGNVDFVGGRWPVDFVLLDFLFYFVVLRFGAHRVEDLADSRRGSRTPPRTSSRSDQTLTKVDQILSWQSHLDCRTAGEGGHRPMQEHSGPLKAGA